MPLTPRQWKLYDFLKENDQEWITQFEIAKRLSQHYGNFNGDPKLFHDNFIRYDLTEDIRKINQSDVIQKIILSSAKGVKIANEEEYRVWSLNKWRSIKSMIKRLAWKDDKAKLNGQMKLVFGDSESRNYFETFAVKKGERDLETEYTFVRPAKNYSTWKITLRDMITHLKDVGQYTEGMTEQEIVERFGDLFEAGAFI